MDAPTWEELECQPWVTPAGNVARVHAQPREHMSPRSVQAINNVIDAAVAMITEGEQS